MFLLKFFVVVTVCATWMLPSIEANGADERDISEYCKAEGSICVASETLSMECDPNIGEDYFDCTCNLGCYAALRGYVILGHDEAAANI
jgi:hypothetical protein